MALWVWAGHFFQCADQLGLLRMSKPLPDIYVPRKHPETSTFEVLRSLAEAKDFEDQELSSVELYELTRASKACENEAVFQRLRPL